MRALVDALDRNVADVGGRSARARRRAPSPPSRRDRPSPPARRRSRVRSASTTSDQRQAVRLEPRAIDDHLDLALRLADQVHRADARHVLEPPLHELVGDVGRGARRQRRRVHRDRHDRHRAGIDALDDRLVDLARQLAADRRHLAADVLRRVQRRHADVELHDDVRQAFLRRRLDVAHALDGVDRFLDQLRHVALDGLRRRARVARRDGDDRELDVGKLVDLERL